MSGATLVLMWLMVAFLFAAGWTSVRVLAHFGPLARPLVLTNLLISAAAIIAAIVVYKGSNVFWLPLIFLVGQLAAKPFRNSLSPN